MITLQAYRNAVDALRKVQIEHTGSRSEKIVEYHVAPVSKLMKSVLATCDSNLVFPDSRVSNLSRSHKAHHEALRCLVIRDVSNDDCNSAYGIEVKTG